MREDRRAKLAETFGDIKNLYSELTNEAAEFGSGKIVEALDEEERYFSSAQGFYKIAVVGSYSTGKTTVLKTLYYDRGLYEVDLPTAADITTQVPTIIKIIPGYSGGLGVEAETLTRPDFIDALKWMVEQINKRVPLERPNFQDLTPASFSQWVDTVAVPVLSQPVRGGTGATQEHFIRELKEAVQIFRTMDPGYKIPTINTISAALNAIKDPKAARVLRSISISIPGRNLTYPVELVDLPGMDVPNLAHKQFSYKFIAEEADAVLFLKDAERPSFTDEEEELLTHIVSKLFEIQQKCFFIFNKWHDTDHPGAEKAVHEVIQKYHFQSRNIFRISALPALIAMEEKSGIDIEGKYRRGQQEWAIGTFRKLKQQFGPKLLEEMGVIQLKEFLEYYCENSLPMLAVRNHAESLNELLKLMNKRLDEMQMDAKNGKVDPAVFEDSDISKYLAAMESFKENVHGIEGRLDDLADSLQESIEKLLEASQGRVSVFADEEIEQLPEGKLARLFHRMGLGRKKPKPFSPVQQTLRKPTTPGTLDQTTLRRPSSKKSVKDLDVPGGKETQVGGVIFDDEQTDGLDSDMPQELVPQRPVDIMTYLEKDMFPTIDVYQRARIIRHYTAGRSKVHSHEIELAVIHDVNKSLREKFLEVLIAIVAHHIEVFCRTIDNEGYLDNIEGILTQFNLHLHLQPHAMFAKFMDAFKNTLNEACSVMAEMAIKKVDEVGVYSEDLNQVAGMSCETLDDCRKKQEFLISYLRTNYEKYLALAFRTLGEEGWDELAGKIAKTREQLVGLLGRHQIIISKIFDERQIAQKRGTAYQMALFEQIEESLREKMAVLKDVAKGDLELKVTERNAKLAGYQQKIQLFSQQCKDLIMEKPS